MDEPREDRMLRRVIALLVLFSGIAERAAGRAFPVHFLVLLALRRAEAVARTYAAGALLVDVIRYEDDGETAGGLPDADTLAWRFRALAAALSTLLAPAGMPHGARENRRAAARRLVCAGSAVGLVASRCAPPWPHDTS